MGGCPPHPQGGEAPATPDLNHRAHREHRGGDAPQPPGRGGEGSPRAPRKNTRLRMERSERRHGEIISDNFISERGPPNAEKSAQFTRASRILIFFGSARASLASWGLRGLPPLSVRSVCSVVQIGGGRGFPAPLTQPSVVSPRRCERRAFSRRARSVRLR